MSEAQLKDYWNVSTFFAFGSANQSLKMSLCPRINRRSHKTWEVLAKGKKKISPTDHGVYAMLLHVACSLNRMYGIFNSISEWKPGKDFSPGQKVKFRIHLLQLFRKKKKRNKTILTPDLACAIVAINCLRSSFNLCFFQSSLFLKMEPPFSSVGAI